MSETETSSFNLDEGLLRREFAADDGRADQDAVVDHAA